MGEATCGKDGSPYFLRALTYVELNPVKANIVKSPYDYWWSSAKALKERQAPKGIIKPNQLQAKCDEQGKLFKANTKTANK
jgi:predicted phosphohydrolase